MYTRFMEPYVKTPVSGNKLDFDIYTNPSKDLIIIAPLVTEQGSKILSMLCSKHEYDVKVSQMVAPLSGVWTKECPQYLANALAKRKCSIQTSNPTAVGLLQLRVVPLLPQAEVVSKRVDYLGVYAKVLAGGDASEVTKELLFATDLWLQGEVKKKDSVMLSKWRDTVVSGNPDYIKELTAFSSLRPGLLSRR